MALLLRVIGFQPGYSPYHSDEGMSYSSAIEMIKRVNIDPGRYDYPALIPMIHAIVYLVFFLPFFLILSFIFSPENIPGGKNLFDLLARFLVVNQQTMVLFWGRFLTALFGVGVVWMVYQVSVKYFIDKRIGLVAAFLTAVNFRQVLNSHFGLPDIYNAFFLLVSFYAFSFLLKRPSFKNYLLSTSAMALYFSTKFQIFVVPAFLLIHLYHTFSSTKKNFLRFLINLFNKKIIAAAILGLLIILVINYADLIHWKEFKDINSYNLLKYGFGIKQFNFYPVSYLYHVGIGPAIFISIFSGILLGLAKYTFRTVILISAVIPFLYIFFYYTRGGYYTRNFVTITPLLLVFAGVFIVNFWSLLLKKSTLLINLLIMLSVLIISYSQISHSLVVAASYIKPWNFEQARNWASTNIPNKAKVVSHPWDKYPRDKDFEIIPLEPSTIFSIAEMRQEQGEYGFINLDWLSLSSYWWINRSTKDSLLFWNRPDSLLSNTFGGVASKEVASYGIATFIKPWQAPEMNILIAKIPGEPEIGKILLKAFNFNNENDFQNWSLIDGDYNGTQGISYDPSQGYKASGSIKIGAGARRFPIILAASPLFEFEGKRAVVVEGWIKTDNPITKNRRDGFLRIDFYKEKLAKINIDTVSAYSSVSPRYFGEGWIKHKIFVIPPDDAKFLTVSLQSNGSANFWFDDVSIYLSKEIYENPRKNSPFIDYQIPNEILFPYSQGGL